MKSLLLLSTIIFAFNSQAALVLNGHSSRCEKKIDVVNSLITNVYSLSNPRIEVDNDTVKLTLNVKFYHCVESNNKFEFISIEDHMSATYQNLIFTDDGSSKYVTSYRKDIMKELAVFNNDYSVVTQTNLNYDIGTQDVTVELDISELDLNTFSQVQHKGNYYTTIALRSITKHYSDESDLGSSLIAYGQYRVFIDLESNTIQF